MSEADYSSMTDEEFDSILEELVGKMSAAQILAYGDVNMFLREELNNEVLTVWEERKPERAFPGETGIRTDADYDRCPRCEGKLTAAFKEHVDYPVEKVFEGQVETSLDHRDTYDNELIHIHCSGCDTYWYSTESFLREKGE